MLKRVGKSLPVVIFALFAILALAVPVRAVEVLVGYADNLRPSPFFPTPFFGDPSVALFAGHDPGIGMDSGAVRIFNNTGSDFVITSMQVHMRNGAGTLYDLWGASFPFTLHPGQNAIFVETAQFNFDSSDGDVLVAPSNTSNCSTGPASLIPPCSTNPAQVLLNGVAFLDTGHVLDTGGFDSVAAPICPNPAEPSGSCNESLQWRDIGTCGLDCPGGTRTPEPSSLLLLGSGLTGVAGFTMRKVGARDLFRRWRHRRA